MAKKVNISQPNKQTKLDTYLKADISSLLKKGDYTTLREMERYLNKMARQRLTRLEKASIKLQDGNVLEKYDKSDFQVSYINKYKLDSKGLKKYQNNMLKSIANAKGFLNLKTSKASNYKSWRTSIKSLGIKFKDNEQYDFYTLLNLMQELAPGVWASYRSSEKLTACAIAMGYFSKDGVSSMARRCYESFKSYFAGCEHNTKEYRIYQGYFDK